jgi:hypothetical protein
MIHSDTLRIEPAYADALAARGLRTAADVLAHMGERVVAWSRTTDTVFVAGCAGQPGFYVKRYFYPRWRHRLRGALRGTFFGHHRGLAEYRALQAMRRLGIPAARPVACGSRRLMHFVSACFLITEEVPDGQNLTSFAQAVAAGQVALSTAARVEIARRLAAQVARMHAGGFAHGQLFWRNIVVRTSPHADSEFFFLDARPASRLTRLGSGPTWCCAELARLAASAVPFTSRAERVRFLQTYLNLAQVQGDWKTWWRQCAAQAARYRRHEAQRIRMNGLFETWNGQLGEHPAADLWHSVFPAGGAS